MEDNKETIRSKHNAVKKVSDRVGLATNYLTHNKIREVEKENSAVDINDIIKMYKKSKIKMYKWYTVTRR